MIIFPETNTTPTASPKPKSRKAKAEPVLTMQAPDKYIFKSVADALSYSPDLMSPMPKPFILRYSSEWWIRCASGDMIDNEVCYEQFMNINALYKKDHPCWNCLLGKYYREARAEGAFALTRFDSLLQ